MRLDKDTMTDVRVRIIGPLFGRDYLRKIASKDACFGRIRADKVSQGCQKSRAQIQRPRYNTG